MNVTQHTIIFRLTSIINSKLFASKLLSSNAHSTKPELHPSFTRNQNMPPKDNIPASFPAADQEIHADSLPEKLGNLPFLHIVYKKTLRTNINKSVIVCVRKRG